MTLRKITFLFCLAALLSLASCQSGDANDNLFLVVDFDPQVPVKYKMVSERNSSVILDSEARKTKPQKDYEKLELIISYKSLGEPDSYGMSTIEATCHSAKVTRKAKVSSPKDPIEALSSRSYTFTVTSIGKIIDYSNLNKLAAELGATAISNNGRQGRIKAPDMIADFVSLQWYLWDSVATCDQAMVGVAAGTSWTSKQFIPLPIPVGFSRDTTYTIAAEQAPLLEGAQETVVIDSVYSVGQGKLENWPKIYTGSFGMKGTFGILRNFRLASIEGTGKQTFNVERGLLEKDVQQYKVILNAGFMFPLAGVSPEVTVDQKMSIELIQ